jgi:hypothetical protein
MKWERRVRACQETRRAKAKSRFIAIDPTYSSTVQLLNKNFLEKVTAKRRRQKTSRQRSRDTERMRTTGLGTMERARCGHMGRIGHDECGKQSTGVSRRLAFVDGNN